MNAWLPQASYPCGNFSDTSTCNFCNGKGSIGHVFTVCIRTENQNQTSFSPFRLHEISVLIELTLGHLRYLLTDVPPQPNSPPDYVLRTDHPGQAPSLILKPPKREIQYNAISNSTREAVVFQGCLRSHLCYIPKVKSQCRTRVKLNRVFFPRCLFQARSLGCGFTR